MTTIKNGEISFEDLFPAEFGSSPKRLISCQPILKGCCRLAAILLWWLVMNTPATLFAADAGFIRATGFPDVSGFSWVKENLFLVVHDTKSHERGPRVSLLQTPSGADGILWKPLVVAFPKNEANDFEGIARIPGTDRFLLCESTEELAEKSWSNRIFLAELQGESLQIEETINWPVTTRNIEGTAVAGVGGDRIFLFAEREHGKKSSEIKIGELRLNPLRIENIRGVGEFVCPYPSGENARPVSAIVVDSAGTIYVASAEDPDDDNGPFSSAVYRIGRIAHGAQGITVALLKKPFQVAVLDGLKVEGLAVRELPGKPPELFVGLDDENYGGTVRPIRLR